MKFLGSLEQGDTAAFNGQSCALGDDDGRQIGNRYIAIGRAWVVAVSYTHLTLPTKA